MKSTSRKVKLTVMIYAGMLLSLAACSKTIGEKNNVTIASKVGNNDFNLLFRGIS